MSYKFNQQTPKTARVRGLFGTALLLACAFGTVTLAAAQVTPPPTPDTIAVPAVLAVFNWSKGTDRYRRIERFVERLFTKWDQFLVAPRHPKWRDVNLGATVPGWTRYIIAEQMLGRFHGPSVSAQEDISRDFQAFLNRIGTGAPQSQADREALFREFLQWREQQSGRRR